MRRLTDRLRLLLGLPPRSVRVGQRAAPPAPAEEAITWDLEPEVAVRPPPLRIVLPAVPGRTRVDLRDFYQTRREIRTIICHHSAGAADATVAAVRRFHTAPPPAGRGWSDIGYHIIMRWTGDAWAVEPGRPATLVGAHDQDQNRDSLGLCLFGDYSSRPVPPDAWSLLVEVVAGMVVLYGLQVSDVEGHRENEPPSTPTSCPGYDPAELRAAVAAHLAPRASA